MGLGGAAENRSGDAERDAVAVGAVGGVAEVVAVLVDAVGGNEPLADCGGVLEVLEADWRASGPEVGSRRCGAAPMGKSGGWEGSSILTCRRLP